MTDLSPALATTARTRPAESPLAFPRLADDDRKLPYDRAAEGCVLASMIIEPLCIAEVAEIISSPEMFFFPEHRHIFHALLELHRTGKSADGVLVKAMVEPHAADFPEACGTYLAKLLNTVPSAANALHYAGIVREQATRREMILVGTAMSRESYDGHDDAAAILDRCEAKIFKLGMERRASAKNTSLIDLLHDAMERLDRGDDHAGIPTGFVELDNLCDGFHRGEMIVLGARPSHGKTALAMCIAEQISIDQQKPGLVFSLEMSKEQLAQRMLCARSGVDSHRLRRGMLNDQDRRRLAQAAAELCHGKLFIDDTSSLNIGDLRSKARRAKLSYGIEFIVVDYLQLMECGGKRAENRQQEITSISRGLKSVAREIDVPVLVLSQLNRSSEQSERLPRMSDLRESGSIEQDADMVMLLHREAVAKRGNQEWIDANPNLINLAELIIAKQRNGPCGIVKLTFLDASTRFVTFNPGV